MPENTILELINANLTNPLGFLFFCLLVDDWRFSPKVMRWIYILFPIVICSLQSTLFLLIDDFVLKRLVMTVAGCSVGVLFAVTATNYRRGRVVFIALTDFSLLLVANVVSECIGSTSTPQRLFIKILIYILVALFICLFLRQPLLHLLREENLSWYRLSLIPLFFGILFLLLMIPGKLYHDPELKVVALALSLALCGCYTAIYHIFRTLKDGYDLKADNELLRTQVANLQSQTDTFQHAYSQVRIFQHDMRSFMQMQAACLEKNDLSGAQRILEAMQKNLDNGFAGWKTQVYTGQQLIDAVLSNYAARAERNGVTLSIELALPEVLPADPGELAVALSNALENALNACLRLPIGFPRIIHLQGIGTQAQFLLAISNTFDGRVEFDPATHLPTTRQSGHGYGTQSIAAFAKRSGATLDYHTEDGWFSLRLLF